ncbi:serine/threonine protein kinase [Paenibacillus sp. GCM10023252]|uniref:serine/threonine protein kinase n=1 Tax=Paenibacillus sp. GCM10023252 TaxID=3252649 RepID=UPI003608E92C
MNTINPSQLSELTALVEGQLIPGLQLMSESDCEPIKVTHTPKPWKVLGAGNYAGVFAHPDWEDAVVKVYAPGREGWESELEVYSKLGSHPAYSECYGSGIHQGRQYLILKRIRGMTLYNCVLHGILIPQSVIHDIDEALDYARTQGLHPHDVHGKNIMIADGRGLVVDVSDFLKEQPCGMWDDLKKAYNRIYMPFLSRRTVPVPEWVMDGVRKGYRYLRNAALTGKSS